MNLFDGFFQKIDTETYRKRLIIDRKGENVAKHSLSMSPYSVLELLDLLKATGMRRTLIIEFDRFS